MNGWFRIRKKIVYYILFYLFVNRGWNKYRCLIIEIIARSLSLSAH